MNRKDLRKIQRFLHAARTHLDSDLTVQRLQLLIEVFLSEPIEQGQLIKMLNQTRSSVSKNIQRWSAITPTKTKGPGYLRSDMDPMNLKTRTINMTDKGKAEMAKLLAELEK